MTFEFSGTAFAESYMQLLILIATNNNEVLTMSQEKPPLDPHPLSEYVAWAGSRNREPLLGVLNEKLPKDPGRGCKPEPQKILSPQFQPFHEQIQIEQFPVTLEGVMSVEQNVSPRGR